MGWDLFGELKEGGWSVVVKGSACRTTCNHMACACSCHGLHRQRHDCVIPILRIARIDGAGFMQAFESADS